METLVPLAGGILIAVLWYDELYAVGEWVGERIGRAIVWTIFGE